MSRARYATDAAVAATAAQTAAGTAGGAIAVLDAADDSLEIFSNQVDADITAIKIEIAAIRTKLGF